jgi:hypothetical protein
VSSVKPGGGCEMEGVVPGENKHIFMIYIYIYDVYICK